MIVIVDSGVANLASVKAALDRLKAESVVSSAPEAILKASHVILPGVGSAQAAMAKLREKGLGNVLRTLKQPVLGICLGMQLLFEGSEEGAEEGRVTPCLGILKGIVRRMRTSSQTPIPHMGWNQIEPLKPAHPLLSGIPNGSHVYFVHSYAAPLGPSTLAACEYGGNNRFAAVVGMDNIHGCQFHPERSSALGSKILRNFLRM